ncbi:uncharacterized protein LOC115621696 [Scaptodrosophila lebanonensis]|uniref:Uncharacterized protein LOC115621696 n=1 Tax=Drosophila lebanonensis TaxID=7225 RepID=A0A6J2T8J3_DROLE|nr:uncharacterized protein LOC115621696 [Scaptodrosophila lebanonensis]
MHEMAADMQKKLRINVIENKKLIKKFNNFEDFFANVSSTGNKKAFKIQPADNAFIRFTYSKAAGNATQGKQHRKQPKYFLNFDFKNYRNPKQQNDEQQKSFEEHNVRSVRTKGPGPIKPYKYFPLKGEDI